LAAREEEGGRSGQGFGCKKKRPTSATATPAPGQRRRKRFDLQAKAIIRVVEGLMGADRMTRALSWPSRPGLLFFISSYHQPTNFSPSCAMPVLPYHGFLA